MQRWKAAPRIAAYVCAASKGDHLGGWTLFHDVLSGQLCEGRRAWKDYFASKTR